MRNSDAQPSLRTRTKPSVSRLFYFSHLFFSHLFSSRLFSLVSSFPVSSSFVYSSLVSFFSRFFFSRLLSSHLSNRTKDRRLSLSLNRPASPPDDLEIVAEAESQRTGDENTTSALTLTFVSKCVIPTGRSVKMYDDTVTDRSLINRSLLKACPNHHQNLDKSKPRQAQIGSEPAKDTKHAALFFTEHISPSASRTSSSGRHAVGLWISGSLEYSCFSARLVLTHTLPSTMAPPNPPLVTGAAPFEVLERTSRHKVAFAESATLRPARAYTRLNYMELQGERVPPPGAESTVQSHSVRSPRQGLPSLRQASLSRPPFSLFLSKRC